MRALKILAWTSLILITIDGWLTWAAVNYLNCIEVNPLMAPIASEMWFPFFKMGIAIAGIGLAVLIYMKLSWSWAVKAVVISGLTAVSVFYFMLAVSNLLEVV